VLGIATAIALKLRLPVLNVRLGTLSKLAIVLVPEASVHEQRNSVTRQDDVWNAREIATV
jgi:hypothetical protein